MKLEAVNPFNANQVCPATVTKMAGRHIWLHFDGSKLPNHIVDVESTDIFPVGWCESNGYTLKTPKKLLGGYCWLEKGKRVILRSLFDVKYILYHWHIPIYTGWH